MKTSLLYTLWVALALLAGCTLHLEGDIYTRDINDALSGETLSAMIRIDVPIPSNDLCLDYRQQYDALFDRSEDFDDMEFVKCFQSNWNEFYAQYELPAPIIVTDSMMADVPIQFVLSDTNLSPMMLFGQGTAVRIVADLDSFVSLNELVMSEFFASFDLLNYPPVFISEMIPVRVFTILHSVLGSTAPQFPISNNLNLNQETHLRLDFLTLQLLIFFILQIVVLDLQKQPG